MGKEHQLCDLKTEDYEDYKDDSSSPAPAPSLSYSGRTCETLERRHRTAHGLQKLRLEAVLHVWREGVGEDPPPRLH